MLLNENALKNLIRSVVKSQYSKKLRLNEEKKGGQTYAKGGGTVGDFIEPNEGDEFEAFLGQKESGSTLGNLSVDDVVNKVKSKNTLFPKKGVPYADAASEPESVDTSLWDGSRQPRHDMRTDFRPPYEDAASEPESVDTSWWDGSRYEDEDRVKFGKAVKSARDTTFIIPKLPRGYYDLAKILINDDKSQNEKLAKNKAGFTNHDFSLFKNEFLNYNLENVKQDLDQEMPDKFDFEKINKYLANEKFLAKVLDKYFQNTALKPGEKIILSDFAHFAKVNALKFYLMKDKDMNVSKENVDEFLSDKARTVAKSNYAEFSKRAGSLTKLMNDRKVGGGGAPGLEMKQQKSQFSNAGKLYKK